MNFTLDSTSVQRALEILNQERLAIRPTQRELRFFRMFRYVSYFLVFAVIALAITLAYVDSPALQAGLFFTVALGFIAVAPLFFLNIRLMRKLWRHARLRRQLQLTDYLKDAFRRKDRKKRSRFGSIVALAAGALGAALVIVSVATGLLLPIVAEAVEIIVVLLVLVIPMAVVGISLISLYFMRRAKEKLDNLDLLYESVAKGGQTPEDNAASLGSEHYYQIADIEREQIIRERTQSISEGQKKALRPLYAVQTSREAQIAKAKLDTELGTKVDHKIFQLINDPSAGATKDPEGSLWRVPVPGTEMNISYQVDETSKRIRIFGLESSERQKADGATTV